jgi:GT2 family glycosyltransferase
MSNIKPKVAIVILTWNGLKLTREVLSDLAKIDASDLELEIIVVDNGSKDNTSKELSSYKFPYGKYKLLINEDNLGFADGNNTGIKYALNNKADYVILMNNDVIVPVNLIGNLVKTMQDDPKIGLASPKIFFASGYEFHKERYKKGDLGKVIWYAGGKIDWNNVYSFHRGVDEVDKGQHNRQGQTDVANAACVIIRRRVLEELDGFDGKYYLYWEDADLCQRAKRRGWKIIYTPKAYIWHKVSQSSGIGSDLNDYFLTRNRMVFGFRYASLRTKLALIRESLKILLNGRKWQRIAIKDFYLGHLGKGSWSKNEN